MGLVVRIKWKRTSGRFRLTAVGKINKYSIFAETVRSICGPTGRVGMIVPSGIATDDTTKVFFADLVDSLSLVSLYDFENREKVFPGIDSRIKFCLLTLTGTDRPSLQAEFAFFLYRAEQLQDAARRFVLAPEDFTLFNPNTRTCPIFRTRRDADIAGKMYLRAGVFWKEARGSHPEVNSWGVKFSQMLNMTSDSHLFRSKEQLIGEDWELEGTTFVKGDRRYLPLYEAKLFHQYDHRFATFHGVDEKALKGGNARNMTVEEKTDPETAVLPRYWVPEEEVEMRLTNEDKRGQTRRHQDRLLRRASAHRQSDRRSYNTLYSPTDLRAGTQGSNDTAQEWELALRLITNATNQRTVMATLIPAVGLGHKGAIVKLYPGLSLSERQQGPRMSGPASHPSFRGQG